MSKHNAEYIEYGSAVLGFELGSTRIKATLIGADSKPLASGSYGWENKLVDGVWTYDLDDVWAGAAACFSDLKDDVRKKYGVRLTRLAAAGFSGMMHGYLVLDRNDRLLTPFRTWRNNITADASSELTKLFKYPIPQRWSIAHLYQSILNTETHVADISMMTSLAGLLHYRLTGEKVIGIGEASGMFAVDPDTLDYDSRMIALFDKQIAGRGFSWKLRDILPKILPAGQRAGTLSGEGTRLLDPSGELQAGVPLCPPEGDAQTGMVATNSIRVRTGNVSAGTSVFAMVVLEKKLQQAHEEIDLMVTPEGRMVGMAHSNNCTSDFDAWINLFGQAAKALGTNASADDLYGKLMPLALEGDPDAGGMLAYGYVSGEHMTGFHEGRPLFTRQPDRPFTLENFLRAHLFAALCALRTGLDVLTEKEGVTVEEIRGHGGLFKTPGVGQRIMAAATDTPVSLLDTAGEGGAWGMALLAAYMIRNEKEKSLPIFLDELFAGSMGAALKPLPEDSKGFRAFFERYHKGLPIERAAVQNL
jgi:sugar (pentulose or hexulose) kinase